MNASAVTMPCRKAVNTAVPMEDHRNAISVLSETESKLLGLVGEEYISVASNSCRTIDNNMYELKGTSGDYRWRVVMRISCY